MSPRTHKFMDFNRSLNCNKSSIFGILFLATAMLAGCATSQKEDSVISGYIFPSAALVPEELLSISVTLEDVSLQDVAATPINQVEYEMIPYWPLPYNLTYEADQLDYRKTYAMRVRVSTVGGTLLAINDIQHEYSISADTGDFDVLIKPLDRSPPIHARFTAECGGEEYIIEVYDALISRFNKNSLSRQIFPRIVAASGTKYKRENEILWTKGDDQLMYLVDGVPVDCQVTPGQ